MSTVEDRLAVRELYGRYAVASAKRNLDEWLASWASNARWKTPHFEIAGHDQLRAQGAGIWANFTNVAAFNEVGDVQFSGDRATSHCSVLEVVTLADGSILTMAGLYEDELVRENATWRFAARSYQTLSQRTVS